MEERDIYSRGTNCHGRTAAPMTHAVHRDAATKLTTGDSCEAQQAIARIRVRVASALGVPRASFRPLRQFPLADINAQLSRGTIADDFHLVTLLRLI